MNIKINTSSCVLESTTKNGSKKFWQAHILVEQKLSDPYFAVDTDRYFTQTSFWQVNKKGEKSIVQWSEPYECTPKNVGKNNETTSKEQAKLEFLSMIKKQGDKGYHLIGEQSDILPLPMLAQKFSERKHKLNWPAYAQPKYNGQRMLYDGKKAWSRSGKLIIPEVIQHLHFDTGGHIIDGELILPKNVLLQDTMKAIKKFREDLSPKLLYIIYDVVDTNKTFKERLKILDSLKLPKNVVKAPTVIIDSENDVYQFHKQFVEEGYEGIIVRDGSEGYQIGHRSNQLQKYKNFTDDEFHIVDIIDGDGKFKESAIFVLKTKHGNMFNCVPEGTMEHRKEIFSNRKSYIGKKLTVRYQELSEDKVPIFPVGVGVRDE